MSRTCKSEPVAVACTAALQSALIFCSSVQRLFMVLWPHNKSSAIKQSPSATIILAGIQDEQLPAVACTHIPCVGTVVQLSYMPAALHSLADDAVQMATCQQLHD